MSRGSLLRSLTPRFLLVALLAGGLWLWNNGRFAQTREVDWQVGEDRASIREVEIQIWNERGQLLKREELFFPDGAPAQIVQRIALADGDYLARVFVKRSRDGASDAYAQTLHVSAKAIAAPLQGEGVPR